MLETLKYVNHMNETIKFGQAGIFVNSNDLRDFTWNITSKNDRISGFSKGIVTKTVPLAILCDSEQEGIKKKNQVFEIMEKDVLEEQHGKLWIGDYYLKCYVTESRKTSYLTDKRYLCVSLTIATDYPSWIKETSTEYNMANPGSLDFLDYRYDHPYDYSLATTGGKLNNTGFMASNFRLTIFGFVTNPTIYINGHEYSVNVTISTGEYLEIDSIQKTIILTRYNGEKVNCFNARNKQSYIFEKIGPGTNIITCEGQLLFTVTLIEERSEPKWI